MVRNPYLRLKESDYEKIFSIFYKLIGEAEDKEEFNKIIFDLLTPAERIMLVKRIAIIYLLLKEIHYQIICEVIKVSSTTVNKYKLFIEKSVGIVPVLKKMLSIEKVGLFFESLFSDIFHPGLPGIDWSSAWKSKIDIARKKEIGL